MAGEALGFTAWEPMQQEGFVADKNSPEQELAIEKEIKKLVDIAYAETKRILTENRVLLDELANTLLEEETIETAKLNELIGKYAMKSLTESEKSPVAA